MYFALRDVVAAGTLSRVAHIGNQSREKVESDGEEAAALRDSGTCLSFRFDIRRKLLADKPGRLQCRSGPHGIDVALTSRWCSWFSDWERGGACSLACGGRPLLQHNFSTATGGLMEWGVTGSIATVPDALAGHYAGRNHSTRRQRKNPFDFFSLLPALVSRGGRLPVFGALARRSVPGFGDSVRGCCSDSLLGGRKAGTGESIEAGNRARNSVTPH